MKKYFMRKYIFTVVFLAGLFGFAAFNLLHAAPAVKESLAEGNVAAIEDAIDENVFLKHAFVEGYGFVQKLLAKDENNNFEVVLDHNGSMYATTFQLRRRLPHSVICQKQGAGTRMASIRISITTTA